ncbi:peptidoglycan D,D-transpeptidase FtsI family protein [Rhodospirillaceae bacterium SYSU D60014]|uniref:peptidoglycan D,D-transpeptidase FtsI family protein n=1 Tax=Virgifigura deserti TaxID=2268457 RepID=UPI000E666143
MTSLVARSTPCNPRHADPRPPRRNDVVHLDGDTKRALEIGRTRLLLAAALFAVAFSVVGMRLIGVTLLQEGGEPSLADVPQQTMRTERADIIDRNGVLLATNLETASLYANPRQVLDAEEAARRIVEVLPEVDHADLVARLSSDRSFIWIKRNLTPRQQYEVNRLGIPGLHFQKEERRVYPQGALTAHVVGFSDIDNRGLAGIELSFNDVLRGGQEPLQLSLDLRIQHILHEELSQAITDFDGIGGAGIVLDTRTGEVLAMVSLPDFDPNAPGSATADARFNRATLGLYEMGSTFKIFNTAMALESGTARLDSTYDASKPIRIGGFTIHDFHGEDRRLTVPEVFIYSSNIGSAKMAEEVGPQAQKAFMKRLGMLRAAGIELPEVGEPMYPAPWRPINMMTISYGHGIAVSPLHVVSAVSAMVNGGVMRPATLIERAPHEVSVGDRVISADTSAIMRRLLRLVVEEGTGSFAKAPGYLVGGKTGTAEKLSGGNYNKNARVASFVGAFPMNDPRYVVLAMIDEPKPNATSYGYATGGWVAAPAVGRLVQRMATLVGMPPVDEKQEADPQGDLLIAVNATDQTHAAE